MKIREAIIWNLIEVLFSTLILFIIYRIVIAKLGLHSIGIWALVLSVTSIARVADLGASGGLSRYVSRASVDLVEAETALTYIRAAFALNVGLYILLSAISYIPIWLTLGKVAPISSLAEARALLPYSMIAFALLNVSAIPSAALTGLGMGAKKSKIMVVTTLIQAVVVFLLVDRVGLIGVAIGQIIQYILSGVVGWISIRKVMFNFGITLVPKIPISNNMVAIRAMISFGAKLQILNIVSMLFDPLVKGSISANYGMNNLAMYELSSRIILQIRQLIISPSQNLIPLYASSLDLPNSKFSDLYEKTSSTVILAASVLMIFPVIFSPFLSFIWLGNINIQFLLFSFILSIAWFMNIAAAPAYMIGIATGQLKPNILASAVMSFVTPALLYLASKIGPVDVLIFAIGFGISAGGIIMIIGNASHLGLQIWPTRKSIRTAVRNLFEQLRSSILLRRI